MYTCVKKLRNEKGVLTGYTLRSDNGACVTLLPQDLKRSMKAGKITVRNLGFTKDGKLRSLSYVEEERKEKPKKATTPEYDALLKEIAKCKLLGRAKEIRTPCGHSCYIISKDKKHHILYIPADVLVLYNHSNTMVQSELATLKGYLRVVGGESVISYGYLFKDCYFEKMDFTYFHTRNCTDMQYMFYNCATTVLDLSTFDTRNVKTMAHMFNATRVDTLNMSSFNTRKVESMACMFEEAYIKKNLLFPKHFNTQNLIHAMDMFSLACIQTLDLRDFYINHGASTDGIFDELAAEQVIITKKDTYLNMRVKECIDADKIKEV